MFFIRLFDEPLAQTSYLIGCATSGTAVVVDPNRRVDQYIAAAERHGLRITAITETHIHADFVSGSRELADRTGASVYLSDCGPPEWQYQFRQDRGVVLLRDGDSLRVGQIELRAVHTPGHTPEHLSFLVTDTAIAPEPMGILTGDFVFVNDVGRPDLLEKAAEQKGAADRGARQLFRSLAWFKALPDHLQIWPGHGAGSACGKGMSAVPQSTVGYERRFNWALSELTEDDFIRQVLAGQPEPPRYFAVMKQINRTGPSIVGGVPRPERVAEGRVEQLLSGGAVIVDLRRAVEFAAGHLPGTLNIPFNNSFATWAGALLPYDRDLYLLLETGGTERLDEAVASLLLIGLDRVRGYLTADALQVWAALGRPLQQVEQVTAGELAQQPKPAIILDVRGRAEWEEGHVPGAVLIPLAELSRRLDELSPGRAIAVHCQGGSRSSIAASLLLASGREAVANLAGGFAEWVRSGLPVSNE